MRAARRQGQPTRPYRSRLSERKRATSQASPRQPPIGGGSGYLTAYQALTSGVYALLWLGYNLIPPLAGRLAPRLAMDLGAPDGGPLVHFHAASVGEISSIAPVVREVRKEVPDHHMLVTTMTATGCRRAADLMPYAECRLVPFDFKPAAKRFVEAYSPRIVVIAETELWPNLITEAATHGASLVLVNGRISTRSIGWYRRVRPLADYMLSQFDLLLMRSEEDAVRIRSLGADPGRVDVTGNTKYDILPGPIGEEERRALRRSLGIGESRPIIVLGSAREDEGEILMRALRGLDAAEAPTVILAPRHLENVPRIERACRQMGYGVLLSSHAARGRAEVRTRTPAAPAGGAAESPVIVVDEMGRLLEYYAVSDIGIVGGTFRPLGGHNPLEPASQGAVVIAGPHRENIADDMEYLVSRHAAVVVDEAGLGAAIAGLLRDPAGMRGLAERGVAAVEARKGASRRCVEAMKARRLLP